MIDLQDLQVKLDDIRGHLESRLSHPYLLAHVDAPVIDDDKLLLLISLMDQHGLEYEKIQNYTVTTMLLQIALDTHEHVRNSYVDESDGSHRSRQLTVLAGVYFSGLYYKLLADTDDILLIRQLAEGVKEVNEHKISVYQKEADAIDRLMDSVRLIESTLLSKIANHFQASEWKDLAENWLFVKRLILEEKKFIQTGQSLVFDVLKKIALPKVDHSSGELSAEQQKYLLSICARYVEYAMELIDSAIKKLPELNGLLADRMKLISGQHQSMSKKIAEEG